MSVRGGVVGYQLPPLRAETLLVFPGDTLIMATDGIRGGFATGLAIEYGPQEIAESILARFAKGTDDAHIVVLAISEPGNERSGRRIRARVFHRT